MKKTLAIIVNPDVDNSEYVKLLGEKFDVKVISGVKTTSDIAAADALLLVDGADVNPQLYAEKIGKNTTIDKARDQEEQRLYSYAKKSKKLIIGFGRGAHLASVLAGGKIIQLVNGHEAPHLVSSNMGKSTFTVPSNHKQMMYPYEVSESKYNLIAFAKRFQSTTYLDGHNEEMNLDEEFLEPEIIYFNNTNSICFQPIPVGATKEYRDVVLSIIDSYLK